MNLQCANCGKEINKTPSQIKRSKTGNMYCSKTCAVSKNNKLFKKWENHPQYKKGTNCYRNIKLESLSKEKQLCEKCGISDKRVLQVHHKDKNRQNNKLENLELLCANCHLIAHYNE